MVVIRMMWPQASTRIGVSSRSISRYVRVSIATKLPMSTGVCLTVVEQGLAQGAQGLKHRFVQVECEQLLEQDGSHGGHSESL